MQKNTYLIKDLENLTGIKAHTIRIWELRHNLLNPLRTTTNIRQYSEEDLKKILNINLLYGNGFKISKIRVKHMSMKCMNYNRNLFVKSEV